MQQRNGPPYWTNQTQCFQRCVLLLCSQCEQCDCGQDQDSLVALPCLMRFPTRTRWCNATAAENYVLIQAKVQYLPSHLREPDFRGSEGCQRDIRSIRMLGAGGQVVHFVRLFPSSVRCQLDSWVSRHQLSPVRSNSVAGRTWCCTTVLAALQTT